MLNTLTNAIVNEIVRIEDRKVLRLLRKIAGVSKMKIYCARPINGCSGEEIIKYYETLQSVLESLGYDVLHPMTAKGYLRNDPKLRAEGYGQPISTNKAIFTRDRWMVRQSDVVYLNLNGATQVSIGCVSELAIAHEAGKHTVLVLPEKNIHEHAFVLEMANIRFYSEQDALSYLKLLVSGTV